MPIDDSQASELMSYFASRAPNGNSPSQLGLQAARSHYATLADNPAGRSVLVLIDGDPSCAIDPVTETVSAVTALADDDVATYVLALGTGSFSSDLLAQSAAAGLVPKPGGPPDYYAADTPDTISPALVGPPAHTSRRHWRMGPRRPDVTSARPCAIVRAYAKCGRFAFRPSGCRHARRLRRRRRE